MTRRKGTAIVIGVFDGVHAGHRALLRAALRRARAHKLSPAVLTFDRHPLAVLSPSSAPPVLMPLRERVRALRDSGFPRVIVLRFSKALSRTSPEDFARHFLARRHRVREVVVGHDFRFGRGGRGNAALLRKLGRELGFGVTILPALRRGGAAVSSTRVRDAVSRGRMEEAARLIGRPYRLDGTVVRGRKRGRKLGFPTINLSPLPGILLPRLGVYAVRLLPGKKPAVADLGVRPTFGERPHHPVLEAHCLGVPPRLRPGAAASVEFLRFLRRERKFSGPAALTKAIALDRKRALRLFRRGI